MSLLLGLFLLLDQLIRGIFNGHHGTGGRKIQPCCGRLHLLLCGVDALTLSEDAPQLHFYLARAVFEAAPVVVGLDPAVQGHL